MVVCNSKDDYEILHSLRAHGWDFFLNKKNNKISTLSILDLILDHLT